MRPDLRDENGVALAPELATGDGALGFWEALHEVWPTTRQQRCWVHKTANVLNVLPNTSRIHCRTIGQRSASAAASVRFT